MTADPQDRRELLPCPFCGGDATTAPASDTDPDLVYAGCMACDVWCDDADAWNRRHPSEGRQDVEGLEYERLKLAYVENTLAANEHDAAGFRGSARPLSEAAEEAEKALDAYVATLREQVERLRGERKVERVADVPAFVAESVMELTTRADTLQRENEGLRGRSLLGYVSRTGFLRARSEGMESWHSPMTAVDKRPIWDDSIPVYDTTEGGEHD